MTYRQWHRIGILRMLVSGALVGLMWIDHKWALYTLVTLLALGYEVLLVLVMQSGRSVVQLGRIVQVITKWREHQSAAKDVSEVLTKG